MRRFLMLLLVSVVTLMAGCDGTFTVPLDKPCSPGGNCCPAPEEPVFAPDPKPLVREILFFTSRGCPPCEAAKPQVAAIRRQGVKITELDFHENPDLVRKYGITYTPTFITLENGVEVERTNSIAALILALVKILAIVLPLLFGG